MSTNEQTQKINGVEVDRLTEIKSAVINEPQLAAFTYIARNNWVDGAHNRSVIKDFYAAGELDSTRQHSFVINNDAARAVLGTDAGANPLEYVIHALAGCLTTTLVYHAALRGIRIDSIESTIEADQDARGFLGTSNSVRNGFGNVRVHFKIVGDAPEAKLRELVLLAQKRSPVFDILSNPTNIAVTGDVKQSKQAA